METALLAAAVEMKMRLWLTLAINLRIVMHKYQQAISGTHLMLMQLIICV
jgi:hypothetical protein